MNVHKKKLVETINKALYSARYFYMSDSQKATTHQLFVHERGNIASVEFLETLSISELFNIANNIVKFRQYVGCSYERYKQLEFLSSNIKNDMQFNQIKNKINNIDNSIQDINDVVNLFNSISNNTVKEPKDIVNRIDNLEHIINKRIDTIEQTLILILNKIDKK